MLSFSDRELDHGDRCLAYGASHLTEQIRLIKRGIGTSTRVLANTVENTPLVQLSAA